MNTCSSKSHSCSTKDCPYSNIEESPLRGGNLALVSLLFFILPIVLAVVGAWLASNALFQLVLALIGFALGGFINWIVMKWRQDFFCPEYNSRERK